MNSVRDVLGVAIPVIQARIAVAEGRSAEALASLRQAVAAEDRLAYNEPKDWFFPVRHLLGAQLMQAGRPNEAEKVYQEDLQQNKENGWALYGLTAALKEQGKITEATQVAQRFKSAWKQADIALTASAF
jgi:tetratricopeptide (TPR) repeat protein